ncbi:uncharacterized protein LACBIDRAFT_301171 [Laccaria bicolor S238N-H82]|uniref:Predicted protein n=1 Tax=Laccaria bicolor (strain S238N-H82 / ATCC MYA-4686) TaxID=486041 RepID=B0CRI1_LACBS|nr:uncharacterized protein LACBIDRAFT_301171 [Laccaria bicolor S238N-H82]EDR15205.1 predicted protein [Laccaria bicolor S238N-H82]|eukprot:XP_001873413.1 predicted protein [Laccaria bicolor S238N-H82]
MFGYFQISTRTKLTFFTTTSPLTRLLAHSSLPSSLSGVVVIIHAPLPTGLYPHVISLLLFLWLSLFPTRAPVYGRYHLSLFWAFVPAHCPFVSPPRRIPAH